MVGYFVAEYRDGDNKIRGYDVRYGELKENVAFFNVSDWGLFAARDGAKRLVELLTSSKGEEGYGPSLYTDDPAPEPLDPDRLREIREENLAVLREDRDTHYSSLEDRNDE
jgi:hypothetical protein